MKCNNCGTDISANAWSCPQCGNQTPHAGSLAGKIPLAIALGVVFVFLVMLLA